MPRKYLPEYLSFTRKERTGIIAIGVLILFFSILPFLFPFFISSKPADHSAFEKEIATLKIKQQDSSGQYKNFDENNYQNFYQPSEKKYYSKESKGELFYFDPNTLPADGWEKLGIKEKTIATIQKYLSKGGKFYKPEDIGKIWGLHEDEIDRLVPFVRIEQKNNDKYVSSENKDFNKPSEKPGYSKTIIDINTADTSLLIALPGIGSKLANRIIGFRDKLGGFYKIEQVAETYALPDSTFQKIKEKLVINDLSVKKININTATIDELKIHPYIRYNIANAIVQYRNQHGDFTTISDLKKIMMITDDIYNKAEPYLSIR
ncbi:MAG: helix-hairpin-helix domain-containing protein [Ferruginibacter sp.]